MQATLRRHRYDHIPLLRSHPGGFAGASRRLAGANYTCLIFQQSLTL